MSAKESAIQDILQDLQSQGKCLIAFRKELNEKMDALTRQFIDLQESITLYKAEQEIM